MLVNDVHKRAAKAALARLVVRGTDPDLAAQVVAVRAQAQDLKLGDLASVNALANYARAIGKRGEGVSNRKWGRKFSSSEKTLIRKLASKAYPFDDLAA